ncbi:MAG: nuclear transport factor 2 family protein [Bdellovibrionota bacterium]
MTRKEAAIQFLKMAGSGDVAVAYDKFIAPDFIHHNQYFKGDRKSLMDAMIDAHEKSPNKSIETKFAIEEGDKVMTYSRVVQKPGDVEIAVAHIFRFKGDRVVELWDLGQMISKDSPNEHGAF